MAWAILAWRYGAPAMKIFTIGFTKTSAEAFFARLQRAGVKRLVDVRLHNVSQLAGFAKRDDLRYFAKTICGIDYVHRPELAPTEEMLEGYKKQGGDWPRYEKRFLDLMAARQVETTIAPEALDGGCLLCSEDRPGHCHRRLVAEYLEDRWRNVDIEHL
jgi:uncharacterized protein (DUF488 family)